MKTNKNKIVVDKAHAIEACRALNRIQMDLHSVEAMDSLATDLSKQPDEVRVSIIMMTLKQALLGLAKFNEFNRVFRGVLPKDLIHAINSLLKQVSKKEITHYRNVVIGHIWDSKKERVITFADEQKYLEKIFDGSLFQFHQWIKKEVAPLILRTKAFIQFEYQIQDEITY